MEKINVFRCIINAKMGEINNKKRELLSKDLSKAYPMVGVSPDNSNLLFLNNEARTTIHINPQQIVYSNESGNISEETVKELQEYIDCIFKILVLDDNVPVSYNFIQNEVTTQGSSMEYSKNFISDDLKDLNDDFSGYGIRTFFSVGDMLSEIRVEPLLTDMTKFYIESLVNYSSVSYKNITNQAFEAYNIFKAKYELLSKAISK